MLPEVVTPLIPFFHPTTVIHVEDNTSYSTLLQSVLEPEILVARHKSARNALAAIEKAGARRSSSQQLVRAFADRTDFSQAQVAAMRDVMFDPLRFNDITVAIVDYAMPDMDGLEFCRQIAHTPIGRVLLTARADRKTATRALDHGLIHYYIDKTSRSFLEEIRNAVYTLQAAYFGSNCQFRFETEGDNRFGFTRDAEVAGALRRYLTIAPVEMYLCDDPAGVLYIDGEGIAELVLVFSEQVYRRHIDEAARRGAPEWYLEHLRARQWLDWRGGSDGFFDPQRTPSNDDLLRATVLHGTSGDYVVATLNHTQYWKHAPYATYRGWLENREAANGV